MSEKLNISPVTLDIVKDSLIAVSNEIFYAFAQTSMSPIIYETLDYASGIADAEGRLLTQGNGVSGFIGMISPMICAVVDKFGKENLHPGDVYIINDPFIGGGTHMSDVGMVMPIFYKGELIAFAGNPLERHRRHGPRLLHHGRDEHLPGGHVLLRREVS